MNILDKIKNFVINLIWQLPLNLCGIVYKNISEDNRIAIVENDDSRSIGAQVILKRSRGGITLGKYIFICLDYKDKYKVIKHECGHVKLSKILGPLYLIIIGIPSILHALLNNYIGCCRKHKDGYYHFYTEHILMKEFDIRNK